MELDHFLSPMKKHQVSPLSSQATQLDSFDDHVVSPAEESGWTTYLDDFSKQRSQYCSSFASSSLVSDAASQYRNNNTLTHKKLSLIKKMRNKHDEELEDTASSPVHSPKVCNDFKKMEMKKVEGHGHFFGHEDGAQYHEKGDGVVFSGPNLDYTSLKKRGLCLVPLSLLSNYIG